MRANLFNKLSLVTAFWFWEFYDFLQVLRHPYASIDVSIVIFGTRNEVVWLLTVFLCLCTWVCISVAHIGGHIERLMARMVLCVWIVVFLSYVFWEKIIMYFWFMCYWELWDFMLYYLGWCPKPCYVVCGLFCVIRILVLFYYYCCAGLVLKTFSL